ncbi:MAG: membrane dipeptidase [Gemmatimonadota bacterium]
MKNDAISRRAALNVLSGAAGALLAAPMLNFGRYRLFALDQQEYSARCLKLMQESVVIDMLSPLTIHGKWQQWARDPESFTEADAQRFKSSGINVFHHAFGLGGANAYDSAVNYFGSVNSLIAGAEQYFMRIDSVADFPRVKSNGKIGIVPGIQNAQHFQRPADVDFFFNIGQRVSQLTYNSRNLIGNGSTERRDEGISDFGVAIIKQMNTTGMVVDVSHCGDRTTLDAFELSTRPVLITHSNCRALADGHPRTKSDDAIRACGKSGGVMGITGVRNFVSAKEPTTVESVIDHFDHVKKLIGVEHLGVGSDVDLDGYDDLEPAALQSLRASYKDSYRFRDKIDIEGLDHPKRMFDLTEGLIRRRYTDAEITGILGGNFARVLGQIWPVRKPA